MIELAGKTLKYKYKVTGGKFYPARQRTSPANARIRIMLVIGPVMKRRFERVYV